MSEDFPVQLAGLRAGSMLAGYRLEAQVGAGGMAMVFRARDERLGRLVALKVLAPTLTADAGFRRRFIAESRAAAAVDEPHIIPVYEAGEADGVLFIAMRFVASGDLCGVLERDGALAPARAAAFISSVASALDAAHDAGLVHRDVKPANILVDAHPGRPEHAYLSDFGVSKGAVSSVSLTGAGHFVGTPDYSAPEQIQGLAVDGRTDQYALACVAFQLLTGVVPFGRDQGMAVLYAHLSAPPPSLASRRPDLPAEADQVLARALAKAPEQRYACCRDFADTLRRALGLAPYIPTVADPAAGHLAPQASLPVNRFSGPAAAGKAGASADLAAAATIDSHVPGASLVGEDGRLDQGSAGHRIPPAPAAVNRRRDSRTRRPRHRFSRLGWLAAALVLVGGGGFAGFRFLFPPHVNTPRSPGPRLSTAASGIGPNGFNAALGKWQHIGNRAGDPRPLALGRLFPPQFDLNGSSNLRTATSLTKSCSISVLGAGLQAELQAGHCSQMLRASYISSDGTMMGTVGVANLTSSAAAAKAGGAAGPKDIIVPLPAQEGATSKLGDGTGVVQALTKGHYLILIWTEFTDLKSPSTSARRQQLETFATNMVIGSANIELSSRMVGLNTRACKESRAAAIACTTASRTITQVRPGALAVTGSP